MGTGRSGNYSGTKGSRFYSGDIYYMQSGDPFRESIKKRSDIDPHGFHDIVAHGTASSIYVEHNGKLIEINHRTLSRLIANNNEASKKAIRLLSCNTGKDVSGFAQNLANKLNRPVKAPTDYLWVQQNGHYFVAPGVQSGSTLLPILNKRGRFKTYYPKKGGR